MDPTACLRLATRLHFMLRRSLDQEFEIGVLMQGGFEARAALRLCRGSGLPDLVSLARELERAHRSEAKANARRAASLAAARASSKAAANRPNKSKAGVGRQAQDLAWSKDTSGFGLSLPPLERDIVHDNWPKPKVGWLALLGLARRNAGH
ncbi:MAG: hypothetical protein WA210_00615 [Burkholderiaceae bacterium]